MAILKLDSSVALYAYSHPAFKVASQGQYKCRQLSLGLAVRNRLVFRRCSERVIDALGSMTCAEHLNNRKGACGCRLSNADNSLSSDSKGLLALVWGAGTKCEESAAS